MYTQNSLDSVTFDGEIYAIPLDTHAEVMYYNKDILEKPALSSMQTANWISAAWMISKQCWIR